MNEFLECTTNYRKTIEMVLKYRMEIQIKSEELYD